MTAPAKRSLAAWILLSTATVDAFLEPAGFHPRRIGSFIHQRTRPTHPSCIQLGVVPKNTATESSTQTKQATIGRNEGVYVRPSAAVERGSGFFIPGLEGPRLRLVAGSLGLALAAWNHYSQGAAGDSEANSNVTINIDEVTAVVFSLLVLLQGSIEAVREKQPITTTVDSRKRGNVEDNTRTTRLIWTLPETSGAWLDSLDRRDRIEWVGQTYLALTPASCLWLLSNNDGIVFRIEQDDRAKSTSTGTDQPANSISDEANYDTDSASVSREAIALLAQSSSGRISLPITHPVSQSLLKVAGKNDSGGTRTLVLQRIDATTSFAMTSTELLAAFRKQDLSWLGQLAKYVAME